MVAQLGEILDEGQQFLGIDAIEAATKRQFCSPVSSPLNDPAKPTGQLIVPVDRICPEVGSIAPEIIRRSEDFPAPFRPSSATETPVGKVAVMLSATTLLRPFSV